ncbi:hypothetical protein ACFP65_07050 [Marinilactibacillus sp. GCM10026970]|uniref:hypothetical protein n=1 Tax=Marinilactibacillus sp. GCM10026970 TaxID=3252642 RepID=UPI00361FC218
MKKILSVLISLLLLVVAVILTLGISLLINYIQYQLFVPNDYLLWTFNSPGMILIVVLEIYLIFGLFYLFRKDFRNTIKRNFLNHIFIKRYKKFVISLFLGLNLFLLYVTLTGVTVITSDKIIDHSFIQPQGQEFTYEDIVKIEARVHGGKSFIPFTHSRGEFLYRLELNNGRKIYLNEVGAVQDSEHEVFVIEDIDRELVNRGIPKTSSMENFELTTEDLAKVYTDSIQRILKNTTSE